MDLITTRMLSIKEQESFADIMPTMPSLTLTPRQLCDLELLLNGGFAPLTGFMGQADYNAVVDHMRLADGTLWPIPITLDVNWQVAEHLRSGSYLGLRSREGILLAILEITDVWQPNRNREAVEVYQSADINHPGIDYLLNHTQDFYVGGNVYGFKMPVHYNFQHLRLTPNELREFFHKSAWNKVVAFQTRNPIHRAHHDLTMRAAKSLQANLLLHPVVGQTMPGDVDYFTRVRCYEKVLPYYPEQTTQLSLLPLAMRMAGPREALWHALIRKNYGCTHFIIGRDHASPGNNAKGKPFYDPYDAQKLAKKYQNDIGIEIVTFHEMVYVASKAEYYPSNEVDKNEPVFTISGTELRRRLAQDLEIPSWFSYPEVLAELKRTFPAKNQRGFTVFFTGLSGAGKTTLANALLNKLYEIGGRSITLLDGDEIRQKLASELTFSKEHRDLNVMRVGYLASEITKHRGIALCAMIAPYQIIREKVKTMIEAYGGFIEVYVATPLDVCEQRDLKGLYQKARAGLLTNFTGVDDPYEQPTNPDLTIDTSQIEIDVAVQQILLTIESKGYL